MTVSPIYTTPPGEGLSPEQQAVFDALAALGIPFQRVEHDRANTMADCKAVSAALGVDVCKNLVLCNRQKTQYYLLTMPSDKAFHTKDLSHQLGCSRLSFAAPEAMADLLHVHPGLRLHPLPPLRQGPPGAAGDGSGNPGVPLFLLPPL